MTTSKPPRELGAIAAAAHALETDLSQFELAAATATRLPLTSQRNLDKAARAINEAADSQRRVAEHIQLLMTALNEARERNQVTAEGLATRSLEIQAKADEHAALLGRFHALGAIAREISTAVRVLGEEKARTPAENAAQLAEIEQRMTVVVDEATLLMKAAHDAGMGELAREVEALAKQVQSARNKVSLVRGKLAPS